MEYDRAFQSACTMFMDNFQREEQMGYGYERTQVCLSQNRLKIKADSFVYNYFLPNILLDTFFSIDDNLYVIDRNE